MMKIAWLCYPSVNWYTIDDDPSPIIAFVKPDDSVDKFSKIVQIAYAEVVCE